MTYLDLVKPDILAKHRGLWVRVSEYGIILGCGRTKEQLEQGIAPHEGCAVALVRVAC